MTAPERCPTTAAALRSNPQPGSEGEPVAWRYRVEYPLGTWHTILSERRPPSTSNAEQVEALGLLAASPTPPTAQPGEVERLRSALEPFANLGVTSGPDDEPCSIPYRITRGSIRRARAVLNGET